MRRIIKENKKTNQIRLYKNAVPKTIYFVVCFLLIGMNLSCSEKYQEINSSQQQYQVKFYKDGTLLKTVPVTGFTVIPHQIILSTLKVQRKYMNGILMNHSINPIIRICW